MKRLTSKKNSNKKLKQRQTIMGIFLALIMLLSVLGFALQGGFSNSNTNGNYEKKEYNGFEFAYINDFWAIGNFGFRYFPDETPNISAELRDATYYSGLPLYIYSENKESEMEIIGNLGQIAERIQNACPEEEQFSDYCEENSPIRNCSENFIIIKKSLVTFLRQEENCVFIGGSEEELLKITDEFLFKILGIK